MPAKKTSTVVFMGAGTSKPFGHPITAEIFPRIWKLLQDGELFMGDGGDLEFFRRTVLKLLPGLPGIKAGNFPLITNVLSLVDGAIDSGLTPVPGLSHEKLLRLRSLLEWAVCTAIHPRSNPRGSTETLKAFEGWLTKLQTRGEPLTLITTNYDVTVEERLYAPYYRRAAARNRKVSLAGRAANISCDAHGDIAADFDFGMTWRAPLDGDERLFERPPKPKVRCYKLHGSLNWLRCDVCDHLYINPDWAINEVVYERASSWNTCECGSRARLRPVIVAPSFIRSLRDTNLGQVWRHAVEALRKADQWVIIGYSFPDEDVAIRSLLMRAYHSRSKPPKVIVVARNNHAPLKDRYRSHFPDAEFRVQGLARALARL
jgi:NAD-dependent SIR2 family protein deacetylase